MLIACSQGDKSLGKSIEKIVRIEKEEEIHVIEVTDFDWAKVFLFIPYSPTEMID